MLSPIHIAGILLTVGALLAVSFLSGRKVKDARSFTTGGTSGSWMVCGAIMGTLVGGQSTIGTAQLAFTYGISAWWFTLGAALGSLVLGLVYAAPLRRSGCTTLTEIVAREYGRKAETVGSLLCMAGIFISIVAQVLSSSAMMTSLFRLPLLWAAVISALLILLFVLFGGIRSAGAGGIIKLVLLYVSAVGAGAIVIRLSGGFAELSQGLYSQFDSPALLAANSLDGTAEAIHSRYFSLLARGPLKDLGGCLSLLLGVLATQTYAQGIWSARSLGSARKGALLCALLIPFIGAASVMIGLYMRSHYVTQAELDLLTAAGEALPASMGVLQSSAEAFPAFILRHMPAWLGGVVLGTLFVTILGGGSGLSLGAATILVRDVYANLLRKLRRPAPSSSNPAIYRWTIAALLVAAVAVSLSVRRAFINDLGYLSLGLRAVAILLPLSFALWLPGRFRAPHVLAAMAAGTAMMLCAHLFTLPADPVYWGLALEALLLPFGWRKTPAHATP